jgi:hypothetical protein
MRNRAIPAVPAKAGKPAIPAIPSPKASANALTTPSRTRAKTDKLTDMGEGFSTKQPKMGGMTRTRKRK